VVLFSATVVKLGLLQGAYSGAQEKVVYLVGEHDMGIWEILHLTRTYGKVNFSNCGMESRPPNPDTRRSRF
jgi:hypothetical protein